MKYIYNSHYYEKNYNDSNASTEEIWLEHFKRASKKIVSDLNPKTTLDVGCAYGYLVHNLLNEGVEAYGIDVSNEIISKSNFSKNCYALTLPGKFPSHLPNKFDLVTCIEVLEHINEDEVESVIESMCKITDKILFSSTPSNIYDDSHFNVQLIEYWSKRFAKHGFFRNIHYFPEYISEWACIFEKSDNVPLIIENFERKIRQLNNKDSNNSFIEIQLSILKSKNSQELLQEKIHLGDNESIINRKILLKNIDSDIEIIFDFQNSGIVIKNLEISSNIGIHKNIESSGRQFKNLILSDSNQIIFRLSLSEKTLIWINIKFEFLNVNNLIVNDLIDGIQ